MAHSSFICILALFSVMSCYHKEKESSENYENADVDYFKSLYIKK